MVEAIDIETVLVYWSTYYNKNGLCLLCFTNGHNGLIREVNSELVYCICPKGLKRREDANTQA